MRLLDEGPAPSEGCRPRVLYVEDDPLNVEVAVASFELDYEVLCATNDEAACALLRAEGARLLAILLDVQLQGSKLNGIELCNLIRGRGERELSYTKMCPFWRKSRSSS